MTEHFQLELGGERLTAVTYAARRPIGATLLLGHGVSGGQKSSFIVDYATALADRGVLVMTYDFPFMAHGHRSPDRFDVLDATFRKAVRAAWECRPKNRLFVGGKSLSGRVATQSMAIGGDELDSVDGIVVLGYPLHPIGRADQAHASHLQRLHVPALFVQGTRDVFGTPTELRNACGTSLPDRSEIFPIEGGDHSLYIREKDVHDEVADEVARWITQNLEGAS